MRVVGLEGDVVDPHLLERLQAVRVVEEAAVDVVPVVLARWLDDPALEAGPRPVVLPHRVGPLEDVRDPADLTFGVGDLQCGVGLEHPRHEVVDHRHRRVHVGEGRADSRRGVRRRGGHSRRRADVHAHHGVAVAVVYRRQPEERGDLGEAHRVAAPRRAALHLLGRELRVPERDQRERDQPSAGRAAPLVEHPVVVGLHAQECEVSIVRLEEGLPAEAWERREREAGLRPVGVHVLDAGLRVEAPRPHLVERDGRDLDLVAVESHRGRQARERVDQIFVEPPVTHRAVGARRVAELPSDERHLPERRAHRPRPDVLVLGGQSVLPDAGRLDDVIVDGDDPGELGHAASIGLTGRQVWVVTPSRSGGCSARAARRGTPRRP